MMETEKDKTKTAPAKPKRKKTKKNTISASASKHRGFGEKAKDMALKVSSNVGKYASIAGGVILTGLIAGASQRAGGRAYDCASERYKQWQSNRA